MSFFTKRPDDVYPTTVCSIRLPFCTLNIQNILLSILFNSLYDDFNLCGRNEMSLKAQSHYYAGGAPVRDLGSTGMNRGSTGMNRGSTGDDLDEPGTTWD
ncbi:hypothetical protein DPMN_130398 [Dreissena polymorpha]|uniref:Uncharacterized protein n=1 Tax=Dreissena polymorpha TaxID=45954 RepID=A0A9D4H2W7_DREPO|nr:hypothetical protein DPMN_130398 [Dreissena polymorpha]